MKDTDHRNSKMHKIVLGWIRKYFPGFSIKENFHITYRGRDLYIDARLKNATMTIFVEIDGEQHDRYVKHFHGNLSEFQDLQLRDSLKEEFAECYEILFLRIKQNFKMTGTDFKMLMFKLMTG